MPNIIGDLDELLTAVQHAAHSEVNDIQTQAQEKAAAVRKEAQQRADRVRKDVLDPAQENARIIQRRRRIGSTREGQEAFLRVREEIMDDVWRRAEERLRDLIGAAAYPDVLERQALAAVRMMGPGEWMVAADAEGQSILTRERLDGWARAAAQIVSEKVTFQRAGEPHGGWGGLIVTDRQGRRRVDATFDTRLTLSREELRMAVYRKLSS